MKESVYEISVRLNKGERSVLDTFKSKLIDSGIKEESIIELHKDGNVVVLFYEKLIKRIDALQLKLESAGVRKKGIRIKKIEENAWVNVWKDSFKPFQLTNNLKVVPVWEKHKYPSELKNIIFIDTKLAFGTGLHETTCFSARLIEKYAGKFQSFFDLGTGTGILAMVALKNGALDVYGVDIDPSAIKIAQQNLKNNGYPESLLDVADIKDLKMRRKKYDLVAANLITHDLIRLKKKIVSFVKKGHYLVISGISAENFPLIKKSFKDLPIRCLKIVKGKKWVAVLYKKI